ncbi:hypothetical protein DFAR_640005 [Desulfarculales bacterium]
MQADLLQNLKIAGVKQNLFSNQAVTAIQQGSGGLFRRVNHLARGLPSRSTLRSSPRSTSASPQQN